MGKVVHNNARCLRSLAFPQTLSLLILAPHPDDFDAIGVAMRYFKENGNPLFVAVATSGASGVEDTFCSPPSWEFKSNVREKEQRESCEFFGLPKDHLKFFRLEEDEAGHPLNNGSNLDCVRWCLMDRRPVLVFLPHWHDTNLGHQRVYDMLRQASLSAGYPLAALLNRDPKTIHMRCDVYLGFGEEEAAWKGKLLRFHRSQHQRNLNHRGHGMDERILEVDKDSAKACSIDMPYAEVFELEFFGAKNLEEMLRGL